MKNFRTYDSAIEFYRLARTAKVNSTLKKQLDRASSSIVLNLAEGRGKTSKADQKRFFEIAFGSVRECQAILTLANLETSQAWLKLDTIAAMLFKLIRNAG